MNLFGFFQNKIKSGISELDNLKELNSFEDDIHSDIFLEKVEKLSDINKKFQKGKNLLHLACEFSAFKLAKTVINLGINIEEEDIYGNTPLWTAVFNSRGNYTLVDLLLDFNANPNSKNKSNISPLEFAEKINDSILINKLKSAST